MTNPDDILAYIEQSEGRFTREAIDAELIRSGHDQTAIDAAWTAHDARQRPGPARNTGSKVAAVILGLLVVATYGLAVLLALAWATMSGSLGGNQRAPLMAVYAAAMIGAGLYSVYRLGRAPSKARGAVAVATAFFISVAMFGGLSGLCVVGLANS